MLQEARQPRIEADDADVFAPWVLSSAQIAAKLGVDPDRGLTESEAVRRRSRFGRNRLREVKARSAWQIAADQFRSIIIGLLVVAAALAFVFGDWMDGIAILIVLVLNALIGFFTELRAVRSMEALKRLSRVSAKVRREDTVKEISAEELVPGDVAVFMEGDIVSADVRLHKTSRLQADESALTGESVPVSKDAAALEPETPLHARSNMLFKGTVITRGTADGIVTATGMHTELGQIARLVAEAEQEITPLEKRLDQLGRKLVWLTLGVTAAVVVAGVSAGRNLLLMVETGIALAVAAVSEGLPIVTTIALARGVARMAERNALLSRLSAIETLGSTSVIFTDKTGTLTENRMTVTHIALASSDVELQGGEEAPRFLTDRGGIDTVHSHELREALEAAVLCNNASLEQPGSGQNESGVGDPLEIALLAAGAKAGLGRRELLQRFPEQRQEAFERDEKMMATFHASGSGSRVAVKGAPEAVLAHCNRWFTEEGTRALGEEDLRRWQQRNVELAARGLRVLALARKNAAGPDAEPYRDLEFLGLLGMADPPRRDVRRAIQDCRTAGVRVVMVTGDQPATARAIANAVGLTSDATAEVIRGSDIRPPEELTDEDRRRFLEASLFARVSPKQKLDLVQLYQSAGRIVAMTGDGVNDAPALKKADIGVAMGRRGTQVAREAADMILSDDAFSTIVVAIEQGRAIFANIRRFVLYLLSCNSSEVLVVGLATVAHAPLPILPLQLLFLNLVTDVFPALAIGVGRGDPSAMRRPPRDPAEPFLTRRHWAALGGFGLLITVSVLAAFAAAVQWLHLGPRQAVTVSFLTLAFAQLFHVFNMRAPGSRLLRNEITENPLVWGAILLCAGLLLAAVYLPPLREALALSVPGAQEWLLILGMSAVPMVVGQAALSLRKKS